MVCNISLINTLPSVRYHIMQDILYILFLYAMHSMHYCKQAISCILWYTIYIYIYPYPLNKQQRITTLRITWRIFSWYHFSLFFLNCIQDFVVFLYVLLFHFLVVFDFSNSAIRSVIFFIILNILWITHHEKTSMIHPHIYNNLSCCAFKQGVTMGLCCCFL